MRSTRRGAIALAVLVAWAMAAAVPAAGQGEVNLLRNGSLEGPTGDLLQQGLLDSGRITGYQLYYDGPEVSGVARSGLQSVNLARGGANPMPWYALGLLRVLPAAAQSWCVTVDCETWVTVSAVPLSAVQGFSFWYSIPNALPSDRTIGFQHFFYVQMDGPVKAVTPDDGPFPFDPAGYGCILHTDPAPLAQTTGWTQEVFDASTTRYYAGDGNCPGGSNSVTLDQLKADPAYANAMLRYAYVQTVVSMLAPWPADAPVYVDDLSLLGGGGEAPALSNGCVAVNPGLGALQTSCDWVNASGFGGDIGATGAWAVEIWWSGVCGQGEPDRVVSSREGSPENPDNLGTGNNIAGVAGAWEGSIWPGACARARALANGSVVIIGAPA
ncbi:MAG: hypothetical protein HY775_12885 [Acidobacteria bacterium]|nr:hypothetical protein [Acidobacteriota bacterium]